MTTIFYSWQSDRSKTTGRNLIEKALRQAIVELSSDAELESAVRDALSLDKDTLGVPGSPPIVETIFRKIDAATVFVPDLSFVGERPDGRPTSNPNVLIEYGWALKALSHERIVPVMNSAYGEPSAATLPFDMQHLRHPITYCCPDEADEATRRKARDELTKSLKMALKTVLGSVVAEEAPSLPEPFVQRQPSLGRARFRAAAEPIGTIHSGLSALVPTASAPAHLASGPAMWLRLMPKAAPLRTFRITELQQAVLQQGSLVYPLNWCDGGGPFLLRGADGFGVCMALDNGKTPCVIYGFETGEVWTVDTYYATLGPDGQLFFSDDNFASALQDCGRLLHRLGIDGPYCWLAGLEGIKGRKFAPVGRAMPRGAPEFLVDEMFASGEYSGEAETAMTSLEPLFATVYDKAHMRR